MPDFVGADLSGSRFERSDLLQWILNEECEHRLHAERNLDALEGS